MTNEVSFSECYVVAYTEQSGITIPDKLFIGDSAKETAESKAAEANKLYPILKFAAMTLDDWI